MTQVSNIKEAFTDTKLLHKDYFPLKFHDFTLLGIRYTHSYIHSTLGQYLNRYYIYGTDFPLFVHCLSKLSM